MTPVPFIHSNEESALKLVFMAIREASKKWTMPIHHWKQALNHFAISTRTACRS